MTSVEQKLRVNLDDPWAPVPPLIFEVPPYVFTSGPEVAALCSDAKFAPDPEQQLALDVTFAERANGTPAAFTVTVKAGRQNLKTGWELQSALGWIYLDEVEKVLYTAHKWHAARQTFEAFRRVVKASPLLARRVYKFYDGHGSESVRFKNGAVMLFQTRSEDLGRAMEGVDKLIMDEGFALTASQIGTILPIMSTRPMAQMIVGSSAGKRYSHVLGGLKADALAGSDPSLAFLEWAAPPPAESCELGDRCDHRRGRRGCACDNPVMIKLANPAVGRRITREYVMVQERNRMAPREYGRERAGWDDPLDEKVEAAEISPLDIDDWARREYDLENPAEFKGIPQHMRFMGVEVDEDHAWASIASSGRRDDGRIHGEMVMRRRGTRWVVTELARMNDEHGPLVIGIDGGGPAASLVSDLEEAGLYVVTLSAKDVAEAVDDTKAGIGEDDHDNQVWHGPDQLLEAAVEGARKKRIGDGLFSLGRIRSETDVTPLLAFIIAVWLCKHGVAGELSVYFPWSADDDNPTEPEPGSDDEWV